MSSRRFLCLLLGLWLGAGLLMDWVAADSLRSANRLIDLPSPEAALHIKAVGRTEARLLLRYQAFEQVRSLLEDAEVVQLFLGGFVFFYLLFGTAEGKLALLLALLMLLTVAVQRFLITPEVSAVGRLIDFFPDVPSGEHAKLVTLRAAYGAAEIFKWGLACFLAGRFIFSHPARLQKTQPEFDPAIRPVHGPVNR